MLDIIIYIQMTAIYHYWPYRVLQSSRAFIANLTMSSNTGSTTHSNLFVVPTFDWLFMIDCSVLVLGVVVFERFRVEGGDELGVMIWMRFCFLFKLLKPPLDDFSVCLFHKFKFWEFSMCFNRQSICCWFVDDRIFFHYKLENIKKSF